MAFSRDFNELLDEILTNYSNLTSDDRIDEGSVLFMKSACTASMLWGLYKALDNVADQMFVETANRHFKEMHAAEYRITTAEKTDSQIAAEVLEVKRSKMSGGNRYDYAAWAREVKLGDESIIYAMVEPLAQGEGTFDIIVVGSKNNGTASDEILNKIKETVKIVYF